MATITKKELIDRISESHKLKRVMVKKVIQQFLEEIVSDLGKGDRLEFRDFGVFEVRSRRARKAQNPKTLTPVTVPPKRTVKFKVGRLMKERLALPVNPGVASSANHNSAAQSPSSNSSLSHNSSALNSTHKP